MGGAQTGAEVARTGKAAPLLVDFDTPFTYLRGAEPMKILITGGAAFIGFCRVVRQAVAASITWSTSTRLTYGGTASTTWPRLGQQPLTARACGHRNHGRAKRMPLPATKPRRRSKSAAESHVDRSYRRAGCLHRDDTSWVHLQQLEPRAPCGWKQGKPEAFRFHHVSTDEV